MPPGVPPRPSTLAGVGGPGRAAAAVTPRHSSKASDHDGDDGSDGDLYLEEFEAGAHTRSLHSST